MGVKLGYFYVVIKQENLEIKKPTTELWVLERRKRDSNPRRCDPQQFSRLPHSTTLPFLLSGGKYSNDFNSHTTNHPIILSVGD
jgi:hypothetical protein